MIDTAPAGNYPYFINKRPVTLFIRKADPSDANRVTYLKRVLTNCTFTGEGRNQTLASGEIKKSSLSVNCFKEPGMTYIDKYEWHKRPLDELEGFWTAELTANPTRATVIVPKETDFVFWWDTVSGISLWVQYLMQEEPGAKLLAAEPNDRVLDMKYTPHAALYFE